MPIYDFKCNDCGKTTELITSSEVREVDCECGMKANRVISMPTIKLEGITGAFPGAYHKWADDHEKRAKKHAEKNK